MSRNNGASAAAIGVGIVVMAILWALTNGFASQPVASSDVTARDATPTANDDIDRGFLPGYVWVDQTGGSLYGLVDASDGAAVWNQLDNAGGTHPVDLTSDVTGGLPSTNILDGTILEVDLKAVDAAADEECLTFEATGGDFEWQTCGAGGGGTHPVDLTSDVTGTLPVANGGTGSTTAAGARTNLDVDQAGTDNSTDVTLAGTPDYITIAGQVIARGTVDIGDDTNLAAGTGATLTGDSISVDLGTAIDTSEITDGTILEADLKAVDAAADEECLTYESTVGDFEWQTCGAGGGADNIDAHKAVSATNNVYWANTNAGIFNSGSFTATSDTMYASPIYLGAAHDTDALTTYVKTASGTGGALGRMCLYEDDGSTYPGALAQDAGTLAVDSTGYKTVTFSAASLSAGLYWIVYLSDVSDAVLYIVATADVENRVLGLPAGQINRLNWGWTVAHTFGTCPDPFTGSGALINSTTSNAPWVGMRLVP